MKLNRPGWLERLREWRDEKKEDVQGALGVIVVFTLLASLLIELSNTYDLDWLAIPAVCFAVIVAISGFIFAVALCCAIVASIVYYPVELSFRFVKLILTLLESLLQLLRFILPHMDVPRFATAMSLLVTFWIYALLQAEEVDTSTLLYLLVASGVAAEVINAVIRHVMARFFRDK